VERTELDQLERVVEREIKARFPRGTVHRVAVLQHGDDPVIEPGELLVRVFIPAPAQPGDYPGSLAAWQEAHRARMGQLRRELSLRLPPARLLEFTFDDTGAATPLIMMRDDGSLAAEQLSGREIVTTALALLRAHYVFPDRAGQAATAIEARLAAGEYDNLDVVTLTDRLTGHLYEVCADKHLRVRPGGGPEPGGGPGPNDPGPGGPGPGPGQHEPSGYEARLLASRQRGRLDNFGIRRVERLGGNIGYLDIRRVPIPANAGPAITAAMELVAGTYALIIDLRRNGGGSPDGVVFWCSYLFPSPPVHFNDIFHADTGETRQFWSPGYVPGTRYLDRPVYVLASSQTFSGGEDFCYTLQALGRAMVIGETTGGGAHPTRGFPISAAVRIAIPYARSINPVTGTNWEGTGVVPDIAVPEAQARNVAYRQALQHVLSIDVHPLIAEEARDALAALPATGQG
jgi:hypothetical protein